MPKRSAIALAAILGLATSQESWALGKVSRACRYTDLPEPVWLFNQAPVFRIMLPGGTFYEGLPVDGGGVCPAGFRCSYWALESFTTDYFQFGRF